MNRNNTIKLWVQGILVKCLPVASLLILSIWLSTASYGYSQVEIDPMVIKGFRAYVERDLRDAERYFLRFLRGGAAIQDNLDSFRARSGLARIYIFSAKLKNVPEGRRQLRYIIDKSKEEMGWRPDVVSAEAQEFADLRSWAIYLMGRSFHLEVERGRVPEEALKRARAYYRQHLEEYPQGRLKSRVISHLSQTYLRETESKNIEKAIDLLETFLNSPQGQEDKRRGTLYLSLAQIYHLHRNDLSRAVKYFSLALDTGIACHGILSMVLKRTATIYDEHLHQPNKALRFYQTLLEEFPTHVWVNVIRERVEEIKKGDGLNKDRVLGVKEEGAGDEGPR